MPKIRIIRIRLLLFVLVLIQLICLNGQEQIPIVAVSATKYNVEDGLKISRITNVVEDKDGFIWISSVKGVQFWDGEEFIDVSDSLIIQNQAPILLKHPRKGVYIISHNSLVHRTASQAFRNVLLHADPSYQGQLLYRTINDRKYEFLVNDSLFQFDEFDKLLSKKVIEIKEASSSSPYFLESSDTTFLSKNLQRFYKRGDIREKSCRSIKNLVGQSEQVCFNVSKYTLHCNGENLPFPKGIKIRFYTSILLQDDRLLVGADSKLFEYDIKNKKWTKEYVVKGEESLMKTGYIDKIMSDQFGTIWIITVNDGLLRLHENKTFKYFGTVAENGNLVKNFAVNKAKNQVLVAGLTNGLLLYDTLGNFREKIIGENGEFYQNPVGVYKIDQTSYLVNSYENQQILRLEFDKNSDYNWSKIGEKTSSRVYYQTAIPIGGNETIFAMERVMKLNHLDGSWMKLARINRESFCGIFHESKLFIGSSGQIIEYDYPSMDERVIDIPSFGYIRSLAAHNENQLWIAGDAGLGLLDLVSEEFSIVYDQAIIYSLLKDDHGYLWMGSNKGLISFDLQEEFRTFGLLDGIQGLEFNTNAMMKASDGELYFGGMNGITSFDPQNVFKGISKHSLIAKSIRANEKRLIENHVELEDIELSLTHKEKSIQVIMGVLGEFDANNYHYAYRIASESSQWIENGNQSKFTFNLSPGEYEVEFRSQWPNQPETSMYKKMKLDIARPWWNSTLFYIVCAVVLLSFLYAIIYYFNQQKMKDAKHEWDLKYKLQEERMNLSRDIHDHIGSQLSYLVTSIDNMEMSPADKEQNLTHLSQFSRKIMADLRSLIWVLNKDDINIEELVLKLLDLIQIVNNTDQELKIDFDYQYSENNPSILDSKKAGHIFRIVQELLHNTVKHAEATEIKLELVSEDQENFKIVYRDNGKGFQKDLQSSGYGTSNIQSRVHEIAGKLTVETEKDKGVCYKIDIPFYTKNSV
ncbi:ATP-binding protein [Saprospiraceae bacterium]|nr:ATP-binding protein [Saprospiraceae bacterium]